MIMDELALARIQLEELTKKEENLVEELSRVRVAIEARKSRIEDLARASAPVNLLPSEILSYVIELAVFPVEYLYQHRMLTLARVSRTWRDIILNSPKFWNHIILDFYATIPFVKEHVERSCQYPLDIAIRFCDTDGRLNTLMDVIIPHVHRWRTLEMYENNHQTLQLILGKINHLKFPSLTRATIFNSIIQDMQYPTFLRPENSPSLKSLHLDNLIPMDELTFGKRITDLSLKFSSHPFGHLALSSLLSSQHLTTLKLAYSTCPSLQPDSISLPFLTSLTLEAKHPRGLISAVVAPQLSYFWLTPLTSADQLSTLFCGFESKFRNVHHFGFHVVNGSISVVDAKCISAVFQNVRHVELHTAEVDDFFRMAIDDSGSCPADNWELLQSLTFHEVKVRHTSSTGHFVRWLRKWNSEGLPMLRVNFLRCTFHSVDDDGNGSERSTPGLILDLHNVLREICILDIKHIVLQAMAVMSLTSASLPSLVRISIVTEWILLMTYDSGFIRSS